MKDCGLRLRRFRLEGGGAGGGGGGAVNQSARSVGQRLTN